MWFKAKYTDSEGNKIKKRSNEEIYEDIYESIDDDHNPVSPFLDYRDSYKEWIKKTYENGGIDLLMSELEKNDYLTEFTGDYLSIPFDVCTEYIEQWYEQGEELYSSTISLIEFPDCWKICQKGYHSELFLYQGLKSGEFMEINGSEKNPGELFRRVVEETLEGIFWESYKNYILEVDPFIESYLMDLKVGEAFDLDNFFGIQQPVNLQFPKKLKKEAFNKLIEEVEGDSYIEDQDRKKYVKKLKEQIDLLNSEKLPNNSIPHQYPWIG